MESCGASSKDSTSWCGAIGCSNSKKKNQNISFHRFPSNRERCRLWVQNCRRQDLMNRTVAYLHANIRICREHFEPSMFKCGSCRLKRNAIPTVFKVPNPPKPLAVKRMKPNRQELPRKQEKQDPLSDLLGLDSLYDIVEEKEQSKENVPPSTENDTGEEVMETSSKRLLINKYRCRIWRQKENIKDLEQKVGKVQPTVEEILAATSLILPPQIQSFLKLQLKLANVKAQGRRYTEEELMQSLAIYYQGARAYRQLRKRFFLPSPSALRRRMAGIQLHPGFHATILSILKEKYAKTGCAKDKLVVLSFDEMQIRPRLKYLKGRDCIEGFEDFGYMGRTPRQADYALVFMARGLTNRWKQPLGYFLSAGAAPACAMEQLLFSVIRKLRDAGFVVAATVCDMGKPNQNLYRRLGVTEDAPHFDVDGKPVTALFDVPHLFKCIRNGLHKHVVFVDGERLSWCHIKHFYEIDKGRPIKAAPRLKDDHIKLGPFKKMKVKFAMQVISRSTASGMLMYSSPCVGLLSPDVQPTARALLFLNNVFDVLNSAKPSDSNPFKRALSCHNENDFSDLLRDARNWIGRWEVGNGVKVDFIGGLRVTIGGVLELWDKLRGAPLIFMMTRRLNQDGLENFFGVIRMANGANDVPNPTAFRHAYRNASANYLFQAPSSANCETDGDVIGHQLLQILTSRACRVDQPLFASRVMFRDDHSQIIDYVPVDMSMANCLSYVAGYVASKCFLKHKCPQCRLALCKTDKVVASEREVLTGLKSCTGTSDADVGSLHLPTDAFFQLVVETYTVTQSQAPTIVLEQQVAARLITCVMSSPEAHAMLTSVCSEMVLQGVVGRLVRLQLHAMCRTMDIGGRGNCSRNRKLLKVSGRSRRTK